jgi:hypothetical protein
MEALAERALLLDRAELRATLYELPVASLQELLKLLRGKEDQEEYRMLRLRVEEFALGTAAPRVPVAAEAVGGMVRDAVRKTMYLIFDGQVEEADMYAHRHDGGIVEYVMVKCEAVVALLMAQLQEIEVSEVPMFDVRLFKQQVASDDAARVMVIQLFDRLLGPLNAYDNGWNMAHTVREHALGDCRVFVFRPVVFEKLR